MRCICHSTVYFHLWSIVSLAKISSEMHAHIWYAKTAVNVLFGFMPSGTCFLSIYANILDESLLKKRTKSHVLVFLNLTKRLSVIMPSKYFGIRVSTIKLEDHCYSIVHADLYLNYCLFIMCFI